MISGSCKSGFQTDKYHFMQIGQVNKSLQLDQWIIDKEGKIPSWQSRLVWLKEGYWYAAKAV